MKARWCARCGKKLLKDANYCTACGAPRENVNLALLGVVAVLGTACIALAVFDWASGFTSMLLGFLPFLLTGLASAALSPHGFVTKQAGLQKYVLVLIAAMMVLIMVATLSHPQSRQWP